MSVVEIRPGIHRLEEPDGARRLCQYLVEGTKRTLVVDAGLPESPERGLLALLRSLGADLRPVTLVLTHPDADHRGGAAVLRDGLPQLEIWGHIADRDQLSDPEATLTERYLAFVEHDGVGPSPERLGVLRARLGRPVRLDHALTGDAELDLGGRRARVLHAPGHSPGSLVVWLPDERAALIGDAVMGRGIPLAHGGILYAPMYAPPAAYEATIERLEALGPELILAGHEPPLEGEETRRFLGESREAAGQLGRLVRQALAGGEPRTLAELCAFVADGYGGLPPDASSSLAMTVDGILGELAERGEAGVEAGPPRRFTGST